jgi:uncharacterized protein YecT (DUF1311 family)
MIRSLAICVVVLVAAITAKNASGQNAGDMMTLFGALVRGAIVEHARIEWSKLSPNEISCVDGALQQQGLSVGTMIQNGIIPTDPQVSSIRSGCRKSTASISPSNPNDVDIDDLSSKPTFDCTNVRSLTGRVMCRDQAGPAADWDINAAYWARYFSLPQDEREAFDEAQQRWLDFLNRTCPKVQNPQQCVLAAYHKRAAEYRLRLEGDAAAESRLSPRQHALIQKSLVTMGFLDDGPDGRFGPITRTAIKQFKAHSGSPESDFLTTQERAQLLEGEGGPKEAVKPPPDAPTPPKVETPRLKEARTFLTDTQQFIGEQKSVPSISAIAKEAADLQIALDKLDEPGAVQAMHRLTDLLKSVPGFDQFMQDQKKFRDDEMARNLARAKLQVAKSFSFIDNYMKDHLGGPKTASILKLREQLDSALKTNGLDEITNANDAVTAYVTANDLSAEYEKSVKKGEDPGQLASGTLIEGPPDDVVLLYNSTSTAPHVWRNVKGDVVFQNDGATRCIAGASDIGVERYVDHILKDHGAKTLTVATSPCDLPKAASNVDIIAFHRSDLLREKVAYKLALAGLLKDNTFRKFDVVNDFAEMLKKRQEFAEQLRAELDQNTRKGFGVGEVNDVLAFCLIAPSIKDGSDGLKEIVKRNVEIIAPSLKSDWKFVETSDADSAYLGLQRRQCGYVVGDSNALRSIIIALGRDNQKVKLSPVWWSDNDIEQAAFDANDARQQEIERELQIKHEKQELERLEAIRQKNKEADKSERERVLRIRNGVKARGLENYVHDLVSGEAQKKIVDTEHLFEPYSSWLDGRFAEKWETYGVNSEVADFGTFQWKGRTLPAVVVKTIINQKNRNLGKYENPCYKFGLVDDEEFSRLREPIAVSCEDARVIESWKSGGKFQSQWNVE